MIERRRRPPGFSWDDDKYATNLKKHGIRFEVATLVFSDIHRLEGSDMRHYDAYRDFVVGSADGIILYVVHTCRAVDGDGEHKDDVFTHLISARRAERNERKRYNEHKATKL